MVADTTGAGASSYPPRLDFDYPTTFNRFWAIPLIGFVARLIILIPHFVVLYLIGIAVSLCQLVLWAPVLFTGRYPAWGYTLIGGYIGWAAEVNAYFYGLTERYPAFNMRSPTAPPAGGEPVLLTLTPAETSTRWMAIPLVGLVVKAILLVPHLLVIYGLAIAVSVAVLIAWAPVLFRGSYPRWARDLVSGYLRWSVRVQGYLFGLADGYPPFRLEN